MLVVDGWLFLLSKSNMYWVFFAGHVSWNGIKESGRNKEISEAIKTQFYYNWNSLLSLGGGKPLQAIKWLSSLSRFDFFFLGIFLMTRNLFFFWACSDCSSCQKLSARLLFLLYSFCFVGFLFVFILFYCNHFYLLFNPHKSKFKLQSWYYIHF